MWNTDREKYSIEESTRQNFLGTTKYEVKVVDLDTGEFATSSRWEFQEKDIIQEAIAKLKSPLPY